MMRDANLARLNNVTTNALNQAVKRKVEHFQEDWAVQHSRSSRLEVAICDLKLGGD